MNEKENRDPLPLVDDMRILAREYRKVAHLLNEAIDGMNALKAKQDLGILDTLVQHAQKALNKLEDK